MAPATRPSPPTGADRAALLFAQHGPEVLRFARRRAPQLADDVLSETFAVAVRRADEIPHGRELPWLYVVAEHVLRNQVRSQQRAQRFREDLALLAPTAAAAHELPLVGPVLGELPDRERMLLVMTALEGLSAAEAADRMGIPYGSARNALVSGRRRLAERLTAAGIAVAAIAVLALVVLLPGRRHEPRSVAQHLERTIATAATVHEVADVRTSGEARSERYERWSALGAGATTVALPGGRALTTVGHETLRDAARRDRLRLSARERAHLDALQVSAPGAIRTMLGTPEARASLARGPRIAGRPTTTFTAERATASGATFRVRVSVANDDSAVLEVQATRLAARGIPGAATTTVRFVTWEPERRTTDGRRPGTPAATPRVPLAIATGAAAAGEPSSVHAHAPGRDHTTSTSEDDRRRPAPNDVASATTPPPAAPATPPILHVKLVDRSGPTETAQRQTITAMNCTESWLELGGLQRFRVAKGWREGRISERWFTGSRTTWWGYDMDGSGVRVGHSPRKDMRPAGPDGGWIRAWLPTIEARRADTNLPSGTTIDGAPAVVVDTSLPTGQAVQILLDPASRAPVEFVVDPGKLNQRTLTVQLWSLLPPGRERSLTGHLPAA